MVFINHQITMNYLEVCMKNIEEYRKLLYIAKGKVIAIIYIFEGEEAPGYKHYDAWRGDLIGEWVQVVQELKCMPLILDARTFVQKAMSYTLPKIDYVVNLNNGNVDISTLGLIPSVCSFLSLPCIPCSTVSIVTGEHKLLSNLIAYAKDINVPKDLEYENENGIVRPLSFGSSLGVERGVSNNQKDNSHSEQLYQQFIPGFDMTTPIMYNPLTSSLEVLPSVMYYPVNEDIEWFLGQNEKTNHCGYKKCVVELDDISKEKYIELYTR